MSNTQGPIKNYWIGFKSKRPFSIIGLVFIVLAFFFVPVLFLFDKLLKEPFEKYDYEKIQKHGQKVKAHITDIEIKHNVRFNEVNPRIITYEYKLGELSGKDKFQTIDIERLESLVKIDSIVVFVYNGQSVIDSLKPVTFPTTMLLVVPGLFLFFGVPLALAGHLAGMRRLQI